MGKPGSNGLGKGCHGVPYSLGPLPPRSSPPLVVLPSPLWRAEGTQALAIFEIPLDPSPGGWVGSSQLCDFVGECRAEPLPPSSQRSLTLTTAFSNGNIKRLTFVLVFFFKIPPSGGGCASTPPPCASEGSGVLRAVSCTKGVLA